jgi:hypothetical protein
VARGIDGPSGAYASELFEPQSAPRLSNNELVDEWDRPCGSGADLAEGGQFTHQFAIADVNHLATFRRRTPWGYDMRK